MKRILTTILFIGALVSMQAFAQSPAPPCNTSTVGAITITRCLVNDADASGGAQWHVFVSSSNPATVGFQLQVTAQVWSSPGGSPSGSPVAVYNLSKVVPRSGATVEFLCPIPGTYDTGVPAPLVSMVVSEVQITSSTAFMAKDGTLP